MKTKIYKVNMASVICMIGALMFSFMGCKTSQEGTGNPTDNVGADGHDKKCCPAKKSHHSNGLFTGDRVYYDFRTKQIFRNKEHTQKQTKPLKMREGSEVQIEISGFNPLRYDIMIGDTAYDRFETNIEQFSKYVTKPNLPSIGDDENKNVNYALSTSDNTNCISIEAYIYLIKEKSRLLKAYTIDYKTYLSYIENINNYFEYLKSMEVINKSDIDTGLNNNVYEPLNNLLPKDKRLKTSVAEVFKSDFIELELYYYEEVNNIASEIKELKEGVDLLKKKNDGFDKFEKNKANFNILYQAMKNELAKFDSVRTFKILPGFSKTMIVYEKLQNLAVNEPVYVTKSLPISKDVQTINIYQYFPATKNKQLYDAINVQLTRGFRIDVSGGLFVSGLSDKKYTLFSKDSIYTTTYINSGTVKDTLVQDKFTAIYSQRSIKVSYGGMIFIHGHSQNAAMLNYGGYIGLGAMFNDQTRWAGSLGFSLIIGKNQRCFIDFGAIISQVDRLRKPYVTGQFYLDDMIRDHVDKVWRASWMLGFSWKIGK